MGAFYIDKMGDRIKQIIPTFKKKGLSNYISLECGEWSILYFPRIDDKECQLYSEQNATVIGVGAFAYDTDTGISALKRMLSLYLSNQLDLRLLCGHYTLIFCYNNRCQIIIDALGTKHVYSDVDGTVFSSSMLAIADAIQDYEVNRDAVLEKLLTGLIISPDTIFSKVIQLSRKNVQRYSSNDTISFRFAELPVHQHGRIWQSTKEKYIEQQARQLQKYLQKWKNEALCGVDLGLSGGYDSTLLFVLMLNAFPKGDIHIHTHSTGHVHDVEKQIANTICSRSGLECNIIETQRLDDINGDLLGLLEENVYFFDGRTAPEIGGFSQTYCSSYRRRATSNMPFTLTGVGGELYRNNYSIPHSRIDCRSFFLSKIFSLFFLEASHDHQLVNRIAQKHINKASDVLGVQLEKSIDFTIAKRYYCQVVMPEGQGHVLDAYNTVSKCIAPFLEPSLIFPAYEGCRFVGTGGDLQGDIITRINPQIAMIQSSYGYPFCRTPIKIKIKEILRILIPGQMWDKMGYLKDTKKKAPQEYLTRVANKCPELSTALSQFTKMFPEIDFSILLNDSRAMASTAYIAMTLYIVTKGKEL